MNAVAESTMLDVIAGIVASTLKIPVGRLDVDADFDSFGMDSIIAIELMTNLSKQLKISITPAQLTAVNSIRELAEAIDATMGAPEPGPQPKAQPNPVAAPAPAAVKATGRASDRAAAQRRPAPRVESVDPLRELLQFVKSHYGLDLRGERFASKDALIDHLVEHHAEVLSHYFGLSADDDSVPDAVAPSHDAMPVSTGEMAIVGMACRFADAKTPDELWQNLVDGRSSIHPLSADRWQRKESEQATGATRWGALIEDVEYFDAAFFGLSEDEAMLNDPQERLVTQALYHALQHAGIRADKLRGSRTGLFLGYEYAEYEHYLRKNLHRMATAPVFSSSSPIYYLANRISFLYDFNGPSEVVNASCASSGLAIHRACQSLAQGECDLAICGGVSLNLFAGDYAAISHYGLLSPDGSCAVFDDNANGFTRGEGLGLLVLKRLEDAEEDNSRIFAKIIATHQNNRGRASFISEIKHEAITQVIRECYEKHSIDSTSMRYIEVDGYATKWGDSFEFEGIKNAFPSDGDGSKHCALGSIKGNIGHVEPASGVASTIKLALSLHHKRFPATITKKTLSSFIDIETKSHPLYIADRPLAFDDLRRGNEPIRAGVNSFSDSGVNVHLVLEEYQAEQDWAHGSHAGPQLFLFSARTPESLLRSLDEHADRMRKSGPGHALEDLAYTLQLSTEPMEHRLAIVAASHGELLQLLARAKKLMTDNRPVDGNGPIFIGTVQPRDSRRLLDVIKAQISEEKLLDNLRSGQLKEIALLWTSGIDMPWDGYWREIATNRRHRSEIQPRLVDAVPYPFSMKRFWLDFDTAEIELPATAPTAVVSGNAPNDGSAQSFVREWKFTAKLDDADLDDAGHAETLDAEEKIGLFLVEETSCLLDIAKGALDEDLNFLELGFDSVGMATLIQQLVHLLGENISPSVVFSNPDIGSLSRYLARRYPGKIDQIHAIRVADTGNPDENAIAARKARTAPKKSDLETWFVSREAVDSGLLVPMQTNASGTPIFAVPGADGSVLSLQTLSRAMDGVRPMFAFQAVGLDGTRDPLGSIREMAEANIDALAAIRDTRRINLLGHSNGAIVAFEMARLLVKRNVTIERLILVDCRCPAMAVRSEADEISEAFVNVIYALGGEHQLNVAEFKNVPEADRAEYLYALMKHNGFEMPHEHFMLAYRLAQANENACRSYRPEKIKKAFETVVVRATQSNGESPPDLGWNRFLPKPAVSLEIDADHLSVIGKEGSALIAKVFQS